MIISPEQLKSFVVDAGLLSKDQFEKALRKSKKTGFKVEDVLMQDNLITQEKLTKLQAYILGIPFVTLEKEMIDPSVLKIIPEPIARFHNIISFRKAGDDL